MGAGTTVTIHTTRGIDTEYRGRHGRVTGRTGQWVMVDLGDVEVGFHTDELDVTA